MSIFKDHRALFQKHVRVFCCEGDVYEGQWVEWFFDMDFDDPTARHERVTYVGMMLEVDELSCRMLVAEEDVVGIEPFF